MDARFYRAAILLAATASLGASHRTDNFIVTAPTPQLAKEMAEAAEHFRRELAVEWLGYELPRWSQVCPVQVSVGEHLGAGGVTSFYFDRGPSGRREAQGWKMSVQGSRERILDSVLPHEVMHTVFATHFRRALPRWADEGACTTVEHASERAKQGRMLIEFLKTNRGIPFDRMFAMKEYPRNDIMPLYSQGYSTTRYLIAQGGKRKFVEFLETGFQNNENWTLALKRHYGFDDLGTLQNTWLDWVRQGSPGQIQPHSEGGTLLADNDKAAPRARPEPNLIHREADHLAANDRADTDADPTGWYARGRMSERTPADPPPTRPAAQPDDDDQPSSQQLVRPQPIERPGQVVLEWSR